MDNQQKYDLMYNALEEIAADIDDCEKCDRDGDMDNYNGYDKTRIAIDTLNKIQDD